MLVQLRGLRQRMPTDLCRIGRVIEVHPDIPNFRAAGRTNDAVIKIERYVA